MSSSGAYQYLLDWHRDRYLAGDPERYARGRHPALYRNGRDQWRLTSAEKKRILLNNIYGVDIDTQAVEVTRLSLLAQLDYFRANYSGASYKLDTYRLFIERGIELLGPAGYCSMITPANFLANNYLAQLRRLMLTRSAIEHIMVIDGGVFRGISVDNAIFW
jgi:hypothetical protein